MAGTVRELRSVPLGFESDRPLSFKVRLPEHRYPDAARVTAFHRDLLGSLLAFVLAPLAFAIQLGLDRVIWTPALFAIGFPVTLAVYYLAWKHIVARFNDVLGIA